MKRTVPVPQNEVEQEVIFFLDAINLLDEILSKQLFAILGTPPNQNILFETNICQKYFYLNLVDFLSQIGICFCLNDQKVSVFEGLLSVSSSPRLGTKQGVSFLKKSLEIFDSWLETEAEIEHWYPDIDKKIILKISRKDMLLTCGNICKHKLLRLSKTADNVKKMFANSDVELTLEEAIASLDNFFERFHDDILSYHSSYIIEMLFNIRRGINEYLKPVYDKCFKDKGRDKKLGVPIYEYEIPNCIISKLGRNMFWELMNNVRSRINWPIPQIKTLKYLKLRY